MTSFNFGLLYFFIILIHNINIFLAIPVVLNNTAVADDSLILVQSVWRHGDRSPLWTYKNNPYQEDDWPQGLGELSAKGMQDQFDLGKKLRAFYVEKLKFLSGNYNSKEIHIRSTDVNRTILSAVSNFAGFYSGSNNDYPKIKGWPKNYVPVPIHTDSDVTTCPRRNKIYNEMMQTPEYKKDKENNKDFMQFLSNHTGEQITFENFWLLYDVLLIEKIYNKKQPDWVTPEVFNKLYELFKLAESYLYGVAPGVQHFKEYKTLYGGVFISDMTDQMKWKIECLQSNETRCDSFRNLKYVALSAHDSTLSSISALLGTGDDVIFSARDYPPYATAITLELWKKGSVDEFYIKLLLWPPNENSGRDITKNIAGCKKGCTFNEFEQLFQNYFPRPSFKERCKNLDL